ncbi:UDP-glucose/GDP-mannose dehydrogenase family protein [Candidatus Saccharibacteria bacterium]|nr:UDP-glucose/GDP-mannose dehydrogenase family protein [Candidatus Saccharibacteria bacterium]
MNIVVIGSGYVGTTAAAIFATSGHKVTAVDIDEKKVASLNEGKAPFFEEGLDNLITDAVKNDDLVATASYEAVASADVVFSCVGTPDNPDGSSNLTYVFDVAKKAAEEMKPGAIFVQKSTVPVGTGREVLKLFPETISYVSNPEFLRESTAIYDTLFFDRVVAGGDDTDACSTILELHGTVETHAKDIAVISDISVDIDALAKHSGEYVTTRLESAELIKVTSNAFLALKISFANSIAQLADTTHADIDEVMGVVGSDARIGKAFFKAGRGYGGGCFPKDVSGLISSAKSFGVNMPIMTAASDVNASMPSYIIERIKKVHKLEGVPVAVLGLAFKAGTSDARKSPAVKLANLLVKEGAHVSAYDPQASEEAAPDLDASATLCESIASAVKAARIVVVATDWPEFKDLSWVRAINTKPLVVDAVNCLVPSDVQALGAEYLGVGRGV